MELEGDDDDGRITYFGFDVDTGDRLSIACMHIDSVVEVDSDGNAVGTSGKKKQRHTIPDFTKQKFEFTTDEDGDEVTVSGVGALELGLET